MTDKDVCLEASLIAQPVSLKGTSGFPGEKSVSCQQAKLMSLPFSEETRNQLMWRLTVSPDVQLEPHSKQILIVPCRTTTAVPQALASGLRFWAFGKRKANGAGPLQASGQWCFWGMPTEQILSDGAAGSTGPCPLNVWDLTVCTTGA